MINLSVCQIYQIVTYDNLSCQIGQVVTKSVYLDIDYVDIFLPGFCDIIITTVITVCYYQFERL